MSTVDDDDGGDGREDDTEIKSAAKTHTNG